MKRAIILSAAVILIILIGLVVFVIYPSLSNNNALKPFYVGVTFGGNTSSDAKLLIDKVKNSTNLFVLQSGILQRNISALDEIGDYAIASGLHFAVYSGVDEAFQTKTWVEWMDSAKQRWGSQFLGIYYNDEPGGKMLDGYVDLSTNGTNIIKLGSTGIQAGVNGTDYVFGVDGAVRATTYQNSSDADSLNGTLSICDPNGSVITTIPNVPRPAPADQIIHYPNGTFAVWNPLAPNSTIVNYYTNGTITIRELPANDFFTVENGSDRISQLEPYSSVLAKSPIKNCDEAAQNFVNRNRSSLGWLDNQSVTVFTSDYALYWWDYQSGYDVVLAELGWNNTAAQEIGLVRGAANLHGKSWGTIITWTYTQQPYLTSGEEMYDQMRLSYESGAEYVVVFNYAGDMNGAYGTLQDEHFQALERFWNEIVQNPNVVHGGVKAEAALVLPKDFGWGMRSPTDTIWGLWNANSTAQQTWAQVQNKLAQYGSRLDIVYEDSTYTAAGKYSRIFYWNQTSWD